MITRLVLLLAALAVGSITLSACNTIGGVGRDVEKAGQKVQAAKKLAPTRPHPAAPNAELFHKVAGPGVGLVDRLRDRLTGRSTS